MPEYVEEFFVQASEKTGLALERRADGLWRADHVPQIFRADELRAVTRFGRPETRYGKFTFRKEIARQSQHLDSELVSPGHALFAAVCVNYELVIARRNDFIFSRQQKNRRRVNSPRVVELPHVWFAQRRLGQCQIEVRRYRLASRR